MVSSWKVRYSVWRYQWSFIWADLWSYRFGFMISRWTQNEFWPGKFKTDSHLQEFVGIDLMKQRLIVSKQDLLQKAYQLKIRKELSTGRITFYFQMLRIFQKSLSSGFPPDAESPESNYLLVWVHFFSEVTRWWRSVWNDRHHYSFFIYYNNYVSREWDVGGGVSWWFLQV